MSSELLREQLQDTLGEGYRLERELGGGGMSRVFLATETALGRRVVVKVLPPEFAAAVSVERFRREIQLAARLQHPHIVPLLSAGESSGFLYYTMPFVEGESLRELLRREGALPIDRVVRIMREVADALAYAHDCGVAHRDVKPDNVLLSRGHALVADFGVAKALSAAATSPASVTATSVTVGTPLYMAPEQIAADPQTDHRADIYALGVVAYELLAGRPPFGGESPQALFAAHMTQVPEPLGRHRAGLPLALERLVMRCLEKRPADRPQSAGEVVHELGAVISSGGPPLGQAEPSRRWTRRTVALAAAASAAVVVTLVGATVARRSRDLAALDPARVVVAPFDNRTGDRSLDPLGVMAADWVTQGLAETGLVRVVDARASLASAARLPGGGHERSDDAERNRMLAATVGAGLVVSGAYYRLGDSLEFRAQVIDAATGNVSRAVASARAPLGQPTAAVEAVRQRVIAALATSLNPRLRDWAAKASQPPSYDAYRAYIEGVEAFFRNDFREASRHYLSAAALDTSFTFPLLWAATAHMNLSEYATADSIVRRLNLVRERLAPVDRAYLDWQLANLRGDRFGAYQAERRGFELSPERFAHQYSNEALNVNRVREALAALAPLGEDGGWMRGYVSYWDTRSRVLHLLGEHGRELEAARLARQQRPDHPRSVIIELRALAALGRLGELDERLDDALAMQSQQGITPGRVLVEAALELRRHGRDDRAQAVVHRALIWYAERSPAERQQLRSELAYTLYLADSTAAARALYERILADRPDDVDALGQLGVIAAKQRDRARAAGADQRLLGVTQPYLFGRHTYRRARIAVQLGEYARAVQLLREARAQGYRYTINLILHSDPDLEPLGGYAPFEELVRPKG